MRFSIAATMLFIFAAGISVTAQNKTITNADLEKYRQQRLRAERDYRDNHVRLGQPSPEELARRNEQSRLVNLELADKLRTEHLQRDRMQFEREQIIEQRLMREQQTVYRRDSGYGPALYGGYGAEIYGGYGFGYDNGRGNRGRGGNFQYRYQQPYYVGGGFIIPVGPRVGYPPIRVPSTRFPVGPRPRR